MLLDEVQSSLFDFATSIVLAVVFLVGAILLYVMMLRTPSAGASLQNVADIPLPGGLPTFDQQALDPAAKLLFVAHSGNNDVDVFNTTTNALVGHIQNIPKNHGITVVHESGRVYVSETLDNQVYVINENTLSKIAQIRVGQKPDVMAFDPNDHLLFVSNELGRSDTVINVNTNQVVATIPLGGEVGNTRYDASLHRVFVSLQTLNQVVAIDPVSRRVVARGTLPQTCHHNHGLVLDVAQQLGIVGCDVSNNVFLLDLQSMHVLSTQAVGAAPDIMSLDDSQHLLHVSSHSGILSIFNDAGRTLQKVNEQCIAANAHTVLVDQETHKIYMPLLKTSSSVCAVPTPAPSAGTKGTPATHVNGQPVLRVLQYQ